jgi:putative transposase
VKTIRTECLNQFVIFGERHLRYLVNQFVDHYLIERYYQGIGSRIIQPKTSPSNDNAMRDPIECRSRLGGLLNFYHRQAASLIAMGFRTPRDPSDLYWQVPSTGKTVGE